MKKENSIDKFNKEHTIKGYTAYDNGGMRFRIDEDNYSLKPFGNSGLGGNCPRGLTVFRKKKGEEKNVELFDLFIYTSPIGSEETISFNNMLDELKKENKDIKQKDYMPYIIWHLTKET